MKSIVRVVSISHKLALGDPEKTVETMLSLLKAAESDHPDICLFPACAFTGSQLGTLHYHETVLSACEYCLQKLLAYSKQSAAYLVVGSMTIQKEKLIPVTYVIHDGHMETVPVKENNDALFQVNGVSCRVLNGTLDELVEAFKQNADRSDITLMLSNTPAKAGSAKKAAALLQNLSDKYSAGIVLANGCIGDTSFPYLMKGISASFVCGKTVAFETGLMDSVSTVSDIDGDSIHGEREKKAGASVTICDSDDAPCKEILPDPYLPTDPEERKAYLLDLFELQAASLALRLSKIYCTKTVIGISGGLDSTLALLVTRKAMDLLKLPSENIIAVTMQGFGTSGKTYQNALTLMKTLGCTLLEVPIRDAVLQHFKDIGHDPTVFDVTYENAQARERTQILLDIANQNGAIVVGTGDLSEEALGFATFAGDHMSNFNVNTCVTKTMIRKLVDVLAETSYFAPCSDVLKAILATPISPELLPVDAQGNIAQKTEEILGPYELHDFFLYYLIRYRMGPKKIFSYAKEAFADRFEDSYIKEKLKIFFRRFCQSQFKRSCTPDSAVLTEVNLSNSEFSMPSDLSAKLFLDEIEAL